MRTWGLVAIATNYTHGTTPDGLPTGPFGASSANILRARKARGLLACLTYVDGKRVAAHGHSMGALLTGMLVGMYGSEFVAASHTAGGVSDTGTVNDGIATTTVAVAMAITVPYQLHHGDSDDVVPLAMDQKLDGILTASGIPHELHVYAGYEHPQVALDALMLTRVRAWYTAHGL
jgi:dienelactone hydrolase